MKREDIPDDELHDGYAPQTYDAITMKRLPSAAFDLPDFLNVYEVVEAGVRWGWRGECGEHARPAGVVGFRKGPGSPFVVMALDLGVVVARLREHLTSEHPKGTQ